MRYLYESHLGKLYISDYYINDDELYCEECGDSDWLLGQFDSIEEFWNLIEDKCDINGSGGYSLQYIYPKLVNEFDLPDLVWYDNYYEELHGFCNAKKENIVRRIEELIGRKVISRI